MHGQLTARAADYMRRNVARYGARRSTAATPTTRSAGSRSRLARQRAPPRPRPQRLLPRQPQHQPQGRVRRRLRDLCLRPRLRRQRRLLPPPRRRTASRPSTAAEHPRLAIRSIALAVILLAVGLLPPRRRSLGGESDDGWCSCARPGPVRRPHPAGFRRAARRPRNGTRWLSKDTGLRDMPTAGAPARQV